MKFCSKIVTHFLLVVLWNQASISKFPRYSMANAMQWLT